MTPTRIAAAMLSASLLIAPAWAHTHKTHHKAAKVAACKTEDQTKGPCFWDAARQGNGKGRSFFLDAEGKVYYRPPAKAGKDQRGKVMTSTGRIAKMDAKGCFFLSYNEAYGIPTSDYDPGDGEFFCAR